MESIIQKERECYICGTTLNLESHHIMHGTSNRKNSEMYGLKVWLCHRHHTGDEGVHFKKDLDLMLKQTAQKEFEKTHTREEFMTIFGRNWL